MKTRISSAVLLRTAVFCALAVAMLGTTGCSWFRKKKKTDAEPQVTMTPNMGGDTLPQDAKQEYAPIEELTPVPGDAMSVIYFDYNQAKLRQDQMARLEKNINYLRSQKDVKIMIEGHCDERGSTEYNYALGEQRARSVADYYIAGGVAAERLRVSSKGEDAPADPGHNEKAWAKNRRAEFYYIRLRK